MKTNIFLAFLLVLCSTTIAHADEIIESYNVLSDEYNNSIHDINVVRSINGGTIIIPEFDVSCPEDIKAPFIYACKIVEEYMPPCLPLKVKVSCGRVNGATQAISKVTSISKVDFGTHLYNHNMPMSGIKGLTMVEIYARVPNAYLYYIPDVDFLTRNPDIEITYNKNKLNEISFSLLPEPAEKYDFITVAIRDILIGLGVSSSFTYFGNAEEGLITPQHNLTPFETAIDNALGRSNSDIERLQIATQGALSLHQYYKPYDLYAPQIWQNGISLNRFIANNKGDFTNVLRYDLAKG